MAEHLLGAPWLCRASEITGVKKGSGESAHAFEESVEIIRCDARVKVVRPRYYGPSRSPRKGVWRKRTVERVLSLWREVGLWWGGDRVERTVFRVLLCGEKASGEKASGMMVSGELVVDLSRDMSGEWSLIGILD